MEHNFGEEMPSDERMQSEGLGCENRASMEHNFGEEMPSDERMVSEGLGCEAVVEDSLDESMKESASVVDSSLTECKHDRENCDATECSFDQDNEESNAGTEGEQIQALGEVDNASLKINDKVHTTRYFIIKSLSHRNIQLSVAKGIWATQIMNEPILEEAFHNSDRVILIFSVNMSGFFQGYAQMMSSAGWRRDNVWSKSVGGSPWGRSFKVKWLRLQDLPFQKTLHLKNPLNVYKPVKISRDCQELPENVGEALCRLFDGESDTKGKLKRNCSFMDDIFLKRSCRNSLVHVQDQGCLVSDPSSNLRWDSPSMLHPSLLYHYVPQHEEHSCRVAQERLASVSLLQTPPSFMDSQDATCMEKSDIHRSSRQGDRDAFLQINKRDTLREGSLPVSLCEEDILNMTYEEYLEAVERSLTPRPHLPAVRHTRTMQAPQIVKDQDDDPYSRYLADWHNSKKTNRRIWSSHA